MRTGNRASRAASQPSLFPFLSVLFCLIGTMMFIGVGIAATGLATAATQVTIRLTSFGNQDDLPIIDRAPIILECTHDTAASLDGRYRFVLGTEREVLRSSRGRASPFGAFLDSLAAVDNQHVLFAVRPDGIAVFKLLRGILEDSNDEHTTATVSVSERPWWERAALPTDLRNKTRYDNGRLSFTGLMSPTEREILKNLFDQVVSHRAVERLFDETRSVVARKVEFGVELVPAEWSIRVTR